MGCVLKQPGDNILKYASAVFLSVLIFILALCSVDNSLYWGDDYAAYINQAIAMSEGRLEEQARLNKLMHPSVLSVEGQGEELIYVWGYPLILSLVYRFVGFDRVYFSSILIYKLPSVIALAGLAGLCFLFFRKRFNCNISFLFALILCCCTEFFDFLNTLYSDMVFLFFAMLSIYLSELFVDSEKDPGRTVLAIILGASLWFTYEIRLNGISIVLFCAIHHAINLLFCRKGPIHQKLHIRQLFPYLVFAVLVFLSEAFIAKATPNTSDLAAGLSLEMIAGNIMSYIGLILHWFELLWDSVVISPLYSVLRRFLSISYESLYLPRRVLASASCILCFLGIVSAGKRDASYSIFIIVYIITASFLPYTQGLRYIYPLLPLLLMVFGNGAKLCLSRFSTPQNIGRSLKIISPFIFAIICALVIYPRAGEALRGEKGVNEAQFISSPSDIYSQNAYSPAAIDMYNYIQRETPEDCCIAFFAPRGLYLNTQRLSIRPGVNGHSLGEADYLLEYLKVGDFTLSPTPGEDFENIYQNQEFILYKRSHR